MKKTIRFYCIIIAAVFIAILIAGCKEAPPKDPRLTPKILSMPKQKMMVAEMKGDPNIKAKIAFAALAEIYGKLSEKVKDLGPRIPRARYPLPPETPLNEYIGIYGFPIPESVTTLPEEKKDPAVNIRIEYWEYGDMGEILHIGPVGESGKSASKLWMFIDAQGYKTAGPWEHEYIKFEG